MRGYETHESFWADAKMYFAMFFRAIWIGLLLQILLMGLVVYRTEDIYIAGTNTRMPTSAFVKYHTGCGGFINEKVAEIEKPLLPYANGWKKLPVEEYQKFIDWLTDDSYYLQHQNLIKWYKLSFFAYLISILYLVVFIGTAKTTKDEKFIRGAQLTPLEILNQKLAAAAQKNPLICLNIGQTKIPFEMESKHMLILGTSGCGKGVLLNQLIAKINARKRKSKTNDRCIFYDVKGEFVAKQFQPGDLVFSPFDSRSLRWNIFNELEIQPDYDVMSRSLFSAPDTKDSYWYNCASDVFRTGLVFLKMNGTTTNADLWNFFSQPLAAIQAAFKTLPIAEQGALKHIESFDSPSSASVISILQERIQFFRYLADLDGDFSFRRFVRDQAQGDTPQPNLFILNIELYSTIFKPLMTLAIDTMVRETLSLPDDLTRRLFFIIDELGTLNPMDSIIKLETVGRSKGGCLICANQDLGRIEKMYGRANLKSFFNNFNTVFTFRIREPEMAEFLSKAIGERQLIKTSHSRQMSPNSIGDRKSISEQEKTERIIMPTEFQDFPDLTAVLNIAGYGTAKITVPPKYFKVKHPNFIMREFAEIPQIPTDQNSSGSNISGTSDQEAPKETDTLKSLKF